MYPKTVGGAEIFDFYLTQELSKYQKIVTIGPQLLEGNDVLSIAAPTIKPNAIFVPIFIFFYITANRRKIRYIHLRYSRSKWIHYWPYVLAKFLFDIPYMITIHGGGLTTWRFMSFFKMYFRNASQVLGVSERICEKYRKYVSAPIINISPLIPLKKSTKNREILLNSLRLKKDDYIILFVGSLKELKHPETLVFAINKLTVDYCFQNKIKVLFAGDGIMKSELAEFSKSNELSNIIRFLGNISREDMPNLYSIASVYIICSDFEGTPLAMLEAIFNNVPVIGADSPGINSIIKHNKNGLLYECSNYSQLADTIKQIRSDPKISARIIKNAKSNLSDSFDYNGLVNKYLNILRN